ncbi:hypothetical protein HK105_203062 [Polyrhizophydium stewartii]|uniref:Peptidase C14 caspase domain-containing protein n=1 Tax=Polyrhizophydium stewartii TaxID=2732419 RepID=A0ABR4NCZ1_9FUNG|nr:Ca(2+)-dependent cysteine protease [Polyrhizophydium stewartii]
MSFLFKSKSRGVSFAGSHDIKNMYQPPTINPVHPPEDGSQLSAAVSQWHQARVQRAKSESRVRTIVRELSSRSKSSARGQADDDDEYEDVDENENENEDEHEHDGEHDGEEEAGEEELYTDERLREPTRTMPPRTGTSSSLQYDEAPAELMQLSEGVLSSCTGTKKALLVGVVYRHSDAELHGCINDVLNVKQFLVEERGFDEDNILLLTEDEDEQFWPTGENIVQGMMWLLEDSKPGDSLVFQFSGHGAPMEDEDGDESDGYDETILPLDFEEKGVLTDDFMNELLVKRLPAGVRLTAIFDCCHSGSALDLPFTYRTDGTLKKTTALSSKISAIGSLFKGFAANLVSGDKNAAISGLTKGISKLHVRSKSLTEKIADKGSLVADVILFSGCKDAQTSEDIHVQGEGTGAMSYALLKSLRANPKITYGELISSIRDILAEFSQIPQISSARYMDLKQPFFM